MNNIGIFLDRDGTINHEVDFLRSPSDLKLIDRSADAIHIANELGIKTIIVTNQSGIARGILTEQQLKAIHDTLLHQLRDHNAKIDAVYYCPHHSDFGEPQYRRDCDCRKPKIGMLLRAAADFSIDLHKSFVVGDKLTDIQTGINAGATSILVSTGYGKDELQLCRSQNIQIDYIAQNLYDAIHFIKKTIGKEQSQTVHH